MWWWPLAATRDHHTEIAVRTNTDVLSMAQQRSKRR